MPIGIDPVQYSEALVSIGHHKYPTYSFDHTNGSVLHNKRAQKHKKIINSLYTHAGQIRKEKFLENMENICLALSNDFKCYAAKVSQLSWEEDQPIYMLGPLNTGLSGVNIKWDASEVPRGGPNTLGSDVMWLSKKYGELAIEIPKIIKHYRQVGLTNFMFPAWDFLATGHYDHNYESGYVWNPNRGLRSVREHGTLIDFCIEDSGTDKLDLLKHIKLARKQLLSKFEYLHNEYKQST